MIKIDFSVFVCRFPFVVFLWLLNRDPSGSCRLRPLVLHSPRFDVLDMATAREEEDAF